MKKIQVLGAKACGVVEAGNGGQANANERFRKASDGSRKFKQDKANSLKPIEATPFWYRLISRSAYRFAEIRDDGMVVIIGYIIFAHLGTYIWLVLSPELNWLQAILGAVFAGWFISLLFLLPAWIIYICVIAVVALCNFAAQRVAKRRKWEVIHNEMDSDSGSIFSDVLSDGFVVGVLCVLTLGFLFSDDC